MDAARAGAVPGRQPGRGAAHHPPAQVGAAHPARHGPRPRRRRPRAGDPAPGRFTPVRGARRRLRVELSLPGAQGLRRGRRGVVLRSRRRRGRLPGHRAADVVAGAGRPVRVRQVLAPARRRGGRAAGAGPPGHHRDARAASARVADRARPGAARRRCLCVDQCEEVFSLCEDPDERRELPGRVLVEQAQRRPVLVAIRADRLADVASHPAFSRLVERGLYLVGALDERRPAPGRRRTGPAGGTDHRARPGRPAGPRGPRRSRGPPAAVPRPAGDLEAPRGQHPDRRGLSGLGRDPRRRRPVRRAALRPRRRRAADTCYATWCCAWSPRAPRANRSAAGSPDGSSPPTPSTTSSSSCSSAHGWSPATTASSRSPTRPSPAPGRGCGAGSTTTSRANGSCTTSPPPPMPGTPSAAPTASSTAASGSPGPSTGRPGPPPRSPPPNATS